MRSNQKRTNYSKACIKINLSLLKRRKIQRKQVRIKTVKTKITKKLKKIPNLKNLTNLSLKRRMMPKKRSQKRKIQRK